MLTSDPRGALRSFVRHWVSAKMMRKFPCKELVPAHFRNGQTMDISTVIPGQLRSRQSA